MLAAFTLRKSQPRANLQSEHHTLDLFMTLDLIYRYINNNIYQILDQAKVVNLTCQVYYAYTVPLKSFPQGHLTTKITFNDWVKTDLKINPNKQIRK